MLALPQVSLQLNEQGLNVALYWRNRDPRSFINIVPTSAITGEGALMLGAWLLVILHMVQLMYFILQGKRGIVTLTALEPVCCFVVCVPHQHLSAAEAVGKWLLGPFPSAGIPDLLQLVVKLTQSLMVERLMFVNSLEVRTRAARCIKRQPGWKGSHAPVWMAVPACVRVTVKYGLCGSDVTECAACWLCLLVFPAV
jgi:hypothetical protein